MNVLQRLSTRFGVRPAQIVVRSITGAIGAGLGLLLLAWIFGGWGALFGTIIGAILGAKFAGNFVLRRTTWG